MRHLPFKFRMLASLPLSLFGAVLLHNAVQAAELSVCIDNSSASAARDQTLAETVAKHENATLNVHRFTSDDDDEGYSAKDFRALLASHCDLILGYPVDTTDGAPPPGLMVTAPYDQTGFSLVTADPLPSDALAGLPDGTEVAVTYGTVPNLYFVTHHNIQSDIHLSEADTLKALVSGKVKAAMLWQPTIAQYLSAHAGAPFSVHALQEPHARWNIVALYGPHGAQQAAAFEADARAAGTLPQKSGCVGPEMAASCGATASSSLRPR
jgi:polar amino acid transport system substrate-binding protein